MQQGSCTLLGVYITLVTLQGLLFGLYLGLGLISERRVGSSDRNLIRQVAHRSRLHIIMPLVSANTCNFGCHCRDVVAGGFSSNSQELSLEKKVRNLQTEPALGISR